MKAAIGAFVAAALFFAGVLVGIGFNSQQEQFVDRIELSRISALPAEQPRAVASSASEISPPKPAERPGVKFEEVEREVEQVPLEEYGPDYVDEEEDVEENSEEDRSGSNSGSGSGDSSPSPSPLSSKSSDVNQQSGGDGD